MGRAGLALRLAGVGGAQEDHDAQGPDHGAAEATAGHEVEDQHHQPEAREPLEQVTEGEHMSLLKRIRDPNQRVTIETKQGRRGRWRWVARHCGACVAVSSVRGYDTEQAARDAAESILNVEGE